MFECEAVSECCLYLRDLKNNNLTFEFLFVLRGYSFIFIPTTTANDFEGFLYQILSITSFSYLNS